MGRVRLASAVKQFLESARLTVAPATLQLYGHYLRKFLAWAGDVPLADLTPAKLLSWSNKYHPLGCVQRLMRWAKNDARLIAVNPLEGMRRVRNGYRRRILSRVERIRLLRGAAAAFRALALALLESIARPRELRGVRWGDIRTSGSPTFDIAALEAGLAFFWIDGFKGQTMRADRYAVRIIPIPPRLGRLLVRLWGAGQEPAALIFRNGKGMPWTCNAVRCQFRRLRVRVHIAADLRGENVVAYSLRHTGATEAVGAGIKGFTLCELMGHSDIRMTQRYVHLRPDHLIEAAGQISEWKLRQKRKNDLPGSTTKRSD